MRPDDPCRRDAAATALAYLAETDPLPAAPLDAIVGFGVFDLRLPRFCAELLLRGVAPRLVFTGGIGAGTGELGGPEADVWRTEVRRAYPQITDDQIVLENRSTNTAENIAFTAALLRARSPALAFGAGLRRVGIVASPSRLRRVRLTMAKLLPEVATVRLLPTADFEVERALYTRNGVDYLDHLAGELDRIVEYPARGWIVAEPLPAGIEACRAILRRQPAPPTA